MELSISLRLWARFEQIEFRSAMAARARPTEPERSLRRFLFQPSFEGVLAMHKIITGRPASRAEIEQLRASMIEDGLR